MAFLVKCLLSSHVSRDMTHIWHVYTHAHVYTSTHNICWWNEVSFSLNKKIHADYTLYGANLFSCLRARPNHQIDGFGCISKGLSITADKWTQICNQTSGHPGAATSSPHTQHVWVPVQKMFFISMCLVSLWVGDSLPSPCFGTPPCTGAGRDWWDRTFSHPGTLSHLSQPISSPF